MTTKRRTGAAALLGLDGFVLLGALEVDGELHQLVETTADRVGCRSCGVVATAHGRRIVKVRDLPAGGRPVVLVWSKRVWRCEEARCEVRTWTEVSAAVDPRAVLTERARRDACKRVGKDGHSVAAVARDLGVGWHSVMQAVSDYGRSLVDDPGRLEGVTALGLDETSFLAAGPTHPTEYVTGFVDLGGRLLDVVPGRSAAAVTTWLAGRPAEWLEAVFAVALDPHRGYANGLVASLGHATVVVDHFHCVRLANAALDDIRRRVQQATLGHRGHKGDPLYRARRLLLRAVGNLSPSGFERMSAALEAGDPGGEVSLAWLAKEDLRAVYAATDRAHARRRLTAFYQRCAEAEIPELTRLARTISAWQEVLAYHDTKLSNGPTEAMILLSGREGVFDVADEGAGARGGRVLWSAVLASLMWRAGRSRHRSLLARGPPVEAVEVAGEGAARGHARDRRRVLDGRRR